MFGDPDATGELFVAKPEGSATLLSAHFFPPLEEFVGYLSLLTYRRDAASHGRRPGIADNEAHTALAVRFPPKTERLTEDFSISTNMRTFLLRSDTCLPCPLTMLRAAATLDICRRRACDPILARGTGRGGGLRGNLPAMRPASGSPGGQADQRVARAPSPSAQTVRCWLPIMRMVFLSRLRPACGV
jgi:hypothetical protein